MMNKYYEVLSNILQTGRYQANKKGDIQFLVNQQVSMSVEDLEAIFNQHPIAKAKLKDELFLYFQGETEIKRYNEMGIQWWDYCSPNLINSYPTYFKKLPALIEQINAEKRNSKNYVLFIGETGVETNQLPCLSLIQFQIVEGELYMSVYQRSADCNLGLPSDIYQMFLISQMIEVPLCNITFFIGNAHIYSNNIESTKKLLAGEKVKFSLNV